MGAAVVFALHGGFPGENVPLDVVMGEIDR
jgi:hypothetical protein